MTDPANHVIQSLWIGPLTTMERLCLRSFLANGHEFHLYTYAPIANVPAGVILKDASAILPQSRLLPCEGLQTASEFFRVALLYFRGGWWTDLDVVCLRPFDFLSPLRVHRVRLA